MAIASSLPQNNLANNTYNNLKFILDYLKSLREKIDKRLLFLKKQKSLIEQRIAEKKQREVEAKKEKENPTAASLIAASGLSQDDIAIIEKRYGTTLYEDLAKLEKALLERKKEVAVIARQERKERVKEKRKEIFKNNAKKCFKIDESELIEISKKNEEAFNNFITGRGKFKSTSSKKAFKTISPLFKGALNSIFYREVEINVLVDEDGRKKKKKSSIPFKEAVVIIYKQTIGRIIENVKTTIDSGVKITQTKIAASKIGGAISNAKTGVAKVGNALKYGYDGLKVGGKVIGGFASAAIPAALLYATTGGAILPAAVAFATIGSANTINSILKDRRLSSIKPIRHFQLKYGEGQFFNIDGSMRLASEKLPALQATVNDLTTKIRAGQQLGLDELNTLKESQLQIDAFQKPNLSQFSRITKALGTGTSLASIAFSIGSLLGVGPQAALIAGLAGSGGSYLYNTLRGAGIKGIINGNSKLLNLFAKIPFASVLDVIQTNFWIGSQMSLLQRVYKGNLGLYLKENFMFGDKTVLTSVLNYIQLASAIASYSGLAGSLLTTINFARQLRNLTAIGIRPTPAGIAALAGSTAALVTLSLLGVPLGPVAMLGAGIGSAIGLAGGIALAGLLLSNPVGWAGLAIIGVVSFITTGVGALIGSIGDKALNKLTGGIMGAINMWASLFQLLSILAMKMNSDNLVMLALSCLSLIQIWSKEQEMATTNVDVTSNKTTSAAPSVESFSFYKVKFINNIPLSAKTRGNLINFIAENKDYFEQKYPDKQIFLTTAPDSSFESNTIVMLSIKIEDVINANYENLAQDIRSQNSNLANINSIIEQQN